MLNLMPRGFYLDDIFDDINKESNYLNIYIIDFIHIVLDVYQNQ